MNMCERNLESFFLFLIVNLLIVQNIQLNGKTLKGHSRDDIKIKGMYNRGSIANIVRHGQII